MDGNGRVLDERVEQVVGHACVGVPIAGAVRQAREDKLPGSSRQPRIR